MTVLCKILTKDVHSIDDKIEYFLTLYTGFSSQPMEQPGGSIVKLPTTVKSYKLDTFSCTSYPTQLLLLHAHHPILLLIIPYLQITIKNEIGLKLKCQVNHNLKNLPGRRVSCSRWQRYSLRGAHRPWGGRSLQGNVLDDCYLSCLTLRCITKCLGTHV